MIYFSQVLEKSTLNNEETLALATPSLEQGKTDILQKYYEKLHHSVALGDMVKTKNL
jgi:hypothetical protein